MTFADFTESLSQSSPPPALNDYLKALWHDGNSSWEIAHTLVQDLTTQEAAHIHAYLHRKEGDNGNASYWYSRAGRNFPSDSLQEEWEKMVNEFLKK